MTSYEDIERAYEEAVAGQEQPRAILIGGDALNSALGVEDYLPGHVYLLLADGTIKEYA